MHGVCRPLAPQLSGTGTNGALPPPKPIEKLNWFVTMPLKINCEGSDGSLEMIEEKPPPVMVAAFTRLTPRKNSANVFRIDEGGMWYSQHLIIIINLLASFYE